MVASIFIVQGYDTFRRPEKVAPLAEPVVRPLADRFTVVPAKAEHAVRLNGAVQMVAAPAGAGPVPAAVRARDSRDAGAHHAAGHRFWEAEEDADQAQQRIHFLKNVSMFGGLLITAADTAGQPSLAWRTRHGVRADMPRGGAHGPGGPPEAQNARREARRTVGWPPGGPAGHSDGRPPG